MDGVTREPDGTYTARAGGSSAGGFLWPEHAEEALAQMVARR